MSVSGDVDAPNPPSPSKYGETLSGKDLMEVYAAQKRARSDNSVANGSNGALTPKRTGTGQSKVAPVVNSEAEQIPT